MKVTNEAIGADGFYRATVNLGEASPQMDTKAELNRMIARIADLHVQGEALHNELKELLIRERDEASMGTADRGEFDKLETAEAFHWARTALTQFTIATMAWNRAALHRK